MACEGGSRVKGESLSQRTLQHFDGRPRAAAAITTQSERSRAVKRVTWKDEREPFRNPSTKISTTPTCDDDSSPKSPCTIQYAPLHAPSFRQDWFASAYSRLNSTDDANSGQGRQRFSLPRAAGEPLRRPGTEVLATLTCDDSSPRPLRAHQAAFPRVPSRWEWPAPENPEGRRGRLNSIDEGNYDLNRQRSSLGRAAGDNFTGTFSTDASGLDSERESTLRVGKCREIGLSDCRSMGRGGLDWWWDDNDDSRANDEDNAYDDDNTADDDDNAYNDDSTYDGDDALGCFSKEIYPNTSGRSLQSTTGILDQGVVTKDRGFSRLSKGFEQDTRRNSGGLNVHAKPSRDVSPSADNRGKYGCSLEQASYYRRLRNDDPSLSVEDFSLDESDANSVPDDSFFKPSHVLYSASSTADSKIVLSTNGKNVSPEPSTGNENEINPVCMGILHGIVSKTADDTVNNKIKEEGDIFVVNRRRQCDQSSPKKPPQVEDAYSTGGEEEEKSHSAGICKSPEDNSDARRGLDEITTQSLEATFTTADGEDDTPSQYFTAEDCSGAEYRENDTYYSSVSILSPEATDLEEALNFGNKSARNFEERKMYGSEVRRIVSPTHFSGPGDGKFVGNDSIVSSEEDFVADVINKLEEADASKEESFSLFTDFYEEEGACFLETVSDTADDYPEDIGHLLSDSVFADDEGADVTLSEDDTEGSGLSSQSGTVDEMLAEIWKNTMAGGLKLSSSEDNVNEGKLRAISPESHTTEDEREVPEIGEEDAGSTLWDVDVGSTLPKDKRTEEGVTVTSTEEETSGEETTGISSEVRAEDEGQRLWSLEDSSASQRVVFASPENVAGAEECVPLPPETNSQTRNQGETETASQHRSNVKGRDVSEYDKAFSVESRHTESIPMKRAAATNSRIPSQITAFSLTNESNKECNTAFLSSCKVGNNLVQNEGAGSSKDDHARDSTENSETEDNGCLKTREDIFHETTNKLSAYAQAEHRRVGAQMGGSNEDVYTEDQNYHFPLPEELSTSVEDFGSAKRTKASTIFNSKPSVKQTTSSVFHDSERLAEQSNSQRVLEKNSKEDTDFLRICPGKELRADSDFSSRSETLPEKSFQARDAGCPSKKVSCTTASVHGALEDAREVSSPSSEENEGTLSLSVEDGTYKVSFSQTGSLQSSVSLTVRLEQGTRRVTSTATWGETTSSEKPPQTRHNFSEPARRRQKNAANAEARRNALSRTPKPQRNISTQTEVDSPQMALKPAMRQSVLSVRDDREKTSRRPQGDLTITVKTRQVSQDLPASQKSLNSESDASFPADIGQHVCQKCGNYYMRVEHLLAHLGEHPVRDLHLGMRCGGCGAQFVSSGALEHHVRLNRMPQAGFRCYRCLRQFRHCDDLYRHYQSQNRQPAKRGGDSGEIWSILGSAGFLVGKESDVYLRPN